MTLIAAFRCRNDGLLLCADREENDGFTKRSVDKIYRISLFPSAEIIIAGSGSTTTVRDAHDEIENSIRTSIDRGVDFAREHRFLIESALAIIHARHKRDLKHWPLSLLIVVATRTPNRPPLLYRSDRETLVREDLYAACGNGKAISDFLSDRLYIHGMRNPQLLVLATFIFRESGNSSSGVGLGSDMVLIYPGGSPLKFYGPESLKELESAIPPMAEAILPFWRSTVVEPDWLREYDDTEELT